MRKLITFVLLISFGSLSFAQSQFELSFEAEKIGNDLKLDYFIQKTAGPDFVIGASNFPIKKELDTDIDWQSATLNPNFTSPFSNSVTPNSYDPLRISTVNHINYTQLTKYNGAGSGFTVNSNLIQIASFLIPLNGPCAEAKLEWEKSWGDINSFATNGDLNSIKSGAIFVDPTNTEFKFFDLPGKPQILQTGILRGCEGQAVLLETMASDFDIQWLQDGIEITGATDSVLNANSSGMYTVQLNNCSVSEMSDPVNVEILPLPMQATISENNGILYSSVSGNIQWYHNSQPIAGATSDQLIPSNSGIYTVKSFNTCGEIFSDPYNYAPLGVDFAQNGASLRVFPNPYIGKTNIEVTLSKETELTVEVYDLKGNLVSLVDEGVYDMGKHQLRFSAQELGFAAGTYVLKVRTNEKELIQNLIELK